MQMCLQHCKLRSYCVASSQQHRHFRCGAMATLAHGSSNTCA